MLIDVEPLAESPEDYNIVFSEMPPVGAKLEASDGYIPGSLIFNIEQFSKHDSSYPHTLLAEKEFFNRLQTLGLDMEKPIVVYDRYGVYSAPRVWFNFRYMGFSDVAVLNGGLPAWIAKGHAKALTAITKSPSASRMLKSRPDSVCDTDYVLAAIDDCNKQIVDLRSSARFNAEVDEPRPGVRRGRIPNSINIPFELFLDAGEYRPISEIKRLFENAGLERDSEWIFLCGSGVTACIGVLAAHFCGKENVKLYDGSWAEWGSRGELPVQV